MTQTKDSFELMKDTSELNKNSFALIYEALEQIKSVCNEDSQWCKRDIARAISKVQDAMTV